ncbi:hypothetical protein ACLOJK_035989 [Asimina triloba]
MATLFILACLQQSDRYVLERISSRSRSSPKQTTHSHQQRYTNLPMAKDDVSPSPSMPYDHHSYSPSHTPPTRATITCTPEARDQLPSSSSKWASTLLTHCARAIANKDSAEVHRLLWMLNELSSPYGDPDQKLAAYFLRAMFIRVTDSGDKTRRALASASEKMCSFDSLRNVVLKFQEISPWATFGHAACNGAILEAFDGETKLHIVDISSTYCTQWPTFLEALATRCEETPHLKITAIVPTNCKQHPDAAHKVMTEIGNRMERFARLMGVPFDFRAVYHDGDLSGLDLDGLGIEEDEKLAVNLVGALHRDAAGGSSRDGLLSSIRRMQPKIVTVVEDEADLNVAEDGGGDEFITLFQECLRWFRLYLEALDESFPCMSNERLVLERAAGRAIVDLIACSPAESRERRERAARWCRRFSEAGFGWAEFSEDVVDDVGALLRRHKDGWSTAKCSHGGMFLTWKQQPVVWACVWKPSTRVEESK